MSSQGWRFVYLLVWGAAYMRRRRDIWEGCGSLVTPGGDGGGSPHLKQTETQGDATEEGWPQHGTEGEEHRQENTTMKTS